MRLFTGPAAYRRYLEASLALALAEIKRDADRRADEDPRVQRLSTIPDRFIEAGDAGTLCIMVGAARIPAKGKVAASDLLFPEGL
jgi:hypothetical protein